MQTAEEKDLAAQSALHLQPADHLLPQDSPSVYLNCKNALINRSSVSQSVSQSNRLLFCGFSSSLQQRQLLLCSLATITFLSTTGKKN
jgi:hypothetical protein